MTVDILALILCCVWIPWTLFSNWVSTALRADDPMMGIAYRVVQFYSRRVHRLTVQGGEHIAGAAKYAAAPGRALMVVCNHTSGIDPALVQASLPFEVRWMMAQDMMLPRYAFLWEWLHIIGVDRTAKRDMTAVREAIRHLSDGTVVGVFPEGGIERPARKLRTFMAGVGLIVLRSNARVLPIFIDGTPVTPEAWDSLWVRSHSRLTVGSMMEFDARTARPETIASALQAWFEQISGWPVLGPLDTSQTSSAMSHNPVLAG